MTYQLHINPEQVFKLTPEQEAMVEDIIIAMEELQIYLWHSEEEEMKDYIKFHKVHGFPGSEIKIRQGEAWLWAMNKYLPGDE